MHVTVFTARLGPDSPPLKPPDVIDKAARYVCFTDSDIPVPAPYQVIRVEETPDRRMTARRIKILADHPIFEDSDATLWHDASYRLMATLDWARKRLTVGDLVAMRHPRRARIEDEALLIARYGYVTSDEGLALCAEYRREGFTQDDVLTSSGLLARLTTEKVAAFNAAWWNEVQRWRGRDQASLDYAAWKTGVTVAYIKGSVRANQVAGFRA